MSSEQQQNHSIQALLNQIARGCHKSAQQLYQKHHRALYAFIRLRVGNDEAAEELVNDTFMVAFRKPHRFDGSCEYRTWLIGIAKRLCSNWLRRRGSGMQGITDTVDIAQLTDLPAEAMTAIEQLEVAERKEAIQICIDKLPERQREAIYWAWHQELKLAEVANNMVCSEGTIKTQLHHARNKIMNCLRQAFGLEEVYA